MTLVLAPPRWHLARANRRRLRHCRTQNLHRWPRSMLTTPAIRGRATVRIPTPSRSTPHSAVARLPHHCGVQTRGFLPWRLSDAGPRARGTIREGPASETLHIFTRDTASLLTVGLPPTAERVCRLPARSSLGLSPST